VVEFASNTAEALEADDAPTITLPLTVALVKVPTLVKLEPVIVDFKVVPDNVPASKVVQVSVPLPVVLNTWLAVPSVFGKVTAPAVNVPLVLTLVTLVFPN
jgi:hypothetical protein